MFDYKKILNGEILKEKSYDVSGSRYYHTDNDCYGLYFPNNKKLIVLQDDFSIDEFAEYICDMLIKNGAICNVCNYLSGDIYYITKDMQHHYFTDYKFGIAKLYKGYKYSPSALLNNTLVSDLIRWKMQPCTFYDKSLSFVVYLLEDSSKEFFGHIIDKEYTLDGENGKYRLCKILTDIFPNIWLSTPKRELMEQFDYDAPEEDITEYRKAKFRTKRLKMRRVISKNYKLYGADFLDEVTKLSDEDKLSLELKGKLPTLAKEKKKKK